MHYEVEASVSASDCDLPPQFIVLPAAEPHLDLEGGSAALFMPLDYSGFQRNGVALGNGGDYVKAGYAWWEDKTDPDEQARQIESTLKHLREHQTLRTTQWVISTRLYGNLALTGRAGVTFSRVAASQPWLKERISWNCVQSAADTVTARMIKNKPKPLFLGSGGDWKIQRKAKLLNKFCEGVFYENNAYRLGPQIFLDGVIWGDGVLHVFNNNGRVCWERVIASELWVDELDGFYGYPRNMHRVKNIDRLVLLEKAKEWVDGKEYKKIAERIKAAPRTSPDASPDYLADCVEVAESWHLPSGEDATDGRHVITIKDTTIISEEWKRDHFPFARFRWTPRLYGFWSQGLAEQLQNVQLEINTILNTIKQSFWKGGTFRVFLEKGSRVVKEHITNQIGSVVDYVGKPPVVVTPPLVQPEIFQHLESLWRRAFEQAGISQLAASSVKPAGLNSGIALREYSDIQSDRFTAIGQEYERFFLDLAKLSIATVKDIVKGGRSYKVMVPRSQKDFQEIDWRDVNLRDDQYVMQCFPISSLPNEPAGRLETIQEWVQAGWITPRQGRRLMDFPDLEMAEGLANAAEDYLTKILEEMIDDGKIRRIEPLDDLKLARELTLEYYQRGKYQNLDENRLDLLRRTLSQIQAYEDQAQQQALAQQMQQQAMQAQPQQGQPPAGPEPRPTSNLVPNTPVTPGAQA